MKRHKYLVTMVFELESGLPDPDDIEDLIVDLNERGQLVPELVDRGEPVEFVTLEITHKEEA